MYSKLTKYLRLYCNQTSRFPHILTVVILCGVTSLSKAQVEHSYARVELHTGTILEGQVVKIEYQKQVDLLIGDIDTMHIPWSDILTISFIDKEIKERAKAMIKPKKANVPFRDSSTYFFYDFGIPLGLNHWGYPVAGGSVNFGLGKGFGYRHHVAATAGYDAYLWPDASVAAVGVEYYGRFKEKDRSWFYFYSTGYGFPHLSEYSWYKNSKVTGGWYFNPGFGITNKRHERRSWYLKFGYKYQSLVAEYEGYVWEYGSNRLAEITENVRYHRIDIRLGFRFD
ncbi:MAG: hypothetical protein ACI8SE_001434 [Bacteroidia bacterium]|jgi:hypothetical protein